MAQVAKDFGISPSCLKRWLAFDERNSSRSSSGPTPQRLSPMRCAKRTSGSSSSSRRTRSCAGLPPTSRRPTCRENDVPARPRAGRQGRPTGVPVAVTCRVLNNARQPYYRWLEPDHRYRAGGLARQRVVRRHVTTQFGYRFLEKHSSRRTDGERPLGICSASVGGPRTARARQDGRPGPGPRRPVRGFKVEGPTGWRPTSPNTGPARASSMSARSRTSTPTGSSATRSTHG